MPDPIQPIPDLEDIPLSPTEILISIHYDDYPIETTTTVCCTIQ